MSKSRYSKTKAAGEAVGLNRYGKQFNQKTEPDTGEKSSVSESRKQGEVRGSRGDVF